MERSWLFAHLAVPDGGCAEARTAELVGGMVAGLVAVARRADPDAHWFFDRLDSPTGPRLRVGLHATEAALDAVRRGHPAASFATDAYPVRDAARGGSLAYASSELALVLLGGDACWLAGIELPLAVAHLRHLTDLLPAADRLGFLFLHWQDRGRCLTGAHRRDLAAQADADAEKIVLAAGDLPLAGAAAIAWRRYLDRVAEVVRGDHQAPRGFLLAQHAQLAHQRWGIDAAVDALAAMALRLALLRDHPLPAPPPAGPTRRQQPHVLHAH